MAWLVHHGLYTPLLIICGLAIIFWAASKSDIDPGPPNARTGTR